MIRRQYAASSAIFVVEGDVGSHDTVEGGALLSVQLANTLVLRLPQLVVAVPGQLLDDLVWQVLRGRVDRRWKAVVHNAGPCGTKAASM